MQHHLERMFRTGLLFNLCIWVITCGGPSNPPIKSSVKKETAKLKPFAFEQSKAGVNPPGQVTVESLGMLVGATYDPEKGRLYLIGSGQDVEASPSAQMIAVAFRRVMSAPARPYIAMQPAPGRQELSLVSSPDVASTEFGSIMCEAGRRLASYSVGYDNLTGDALTLPTDGSQNHLPFTAASESQEVSGYQQFWLSPSESNQVIADEYNVKIVTSSVTVTAQHMQIANGELTATGTPPAPGAETFAQFVSEHFTSLAATEPSFKKLAQLVRLLQVAEWARQYNIPVALNWIDENAKVHYALPKTTGDTARGSQSQTGVSQGALGGVNFQEVPISFESEAESSFLRVPQDVAEVLSPGKAWRYERDNLAFVTTALPAGDKAPTRELVPLFSISLSSGPFSLLTRPAESVDLPAHPKTDRVIALPKLLASNSLGNADAMMGVLGEESTLVQVHRYELYNPDGTVLAVFDEHEIDLLQGRIRVKPTDPASNLRLYLSRSTVVDVMGYSDGVIRKFDSATGQLLLEKRGGDVLLYEYNKHGKLDNLMLLDTAEGEHTPLVQFQHGPNGQMVRAVKHIKSGDVFPLTPRAEPPSSPTARQESQPGTPRRL